jgi:hypothetical protein
VEKLKLKSTKQAKTVQDDESFNHEDDLVAISARETGERLPCGFSVLRSFGEKLF